MKFKKLRIFGQFKRFHDLTIDLGDSPRRIVALVGPNGCGKSSVLDALVFLAHQYHGIGTGLNKNNDYYSMTSTQKVNANNVDIWLDDGRKWIEEFQSRQSTGKHSTLLSIRSPYRYSSELKVAQTSAVNPISDNSYGASTFSDLDKKIEMNYRRLQAHLQEQLGEKDLPLSKTLELIIGELNSSIQNCLDMRIVSIGDVMSGRGTLFFAKADHPAPFEFNVLSSGEKEVVDILLDLYLRKKEYNNTVFLIDEPELHINSSIQRRLFLEINKMVGDDCQIWVATHSIGLLRCLQTDLNDQSSIIEFDPKADYAKNVHVLKPAELGFRNWRRILATALDDLSDLVLPKQLIYCEGRDRPKGDGRERGLDAKVYNQIFGNSHSETLFVSSGGNTELDQRSEIALEILGKATKDLDILVLKDRDVGSGQEVTQADRISYLTNNPDNHRMLKRIEIENYLFDHEVVASYCAAHDLQFDKESYISTMGDFFDQDVKSKIGAVKKFCGIKTSVSPDQFKLNLARHITKGMSVYDELSSCIFDK